MAILIDISQIIISNIMMLPRSQSGQVDSLLVKHMILNSLRAYKVRFGREYGEMVICCDTRNTWRYDVFPHYKQRRKAAHKSSPYDWQSIYTAINEMKAELREFFPYKVIEVKDLPPTDLGGRAGGAEADDILGTLAKNLNGPVLIITGDKDMIQLLKYPNVKIYNPIKKKFVEHANPDFFLMEQIIRGDDGDDIPNILSDADTFVTEGKRQKSIMSAKLDVWIKKNPEEFCESNKVLERFKENQVLIDLDFIPRPLQERIMEEYEVPPKGNRDLIMQYFVKNRMRNLLEDLGQF